MFGVELCLGDAPGREVGDLVLGHGAATDESLESVAADAEIFGGPCAREALGVGVAEQLDGVVLAEVVSALLGPREAAGSALVSSKPPPDAQAYRIDTASPNAEVCA